MRNTKEMMDLLLDIAENDERIRAVYMNGSRVNKNVPKDIYQDYDIVFVVREMAPFLADKAWILHFGNPLIVQEPMRNDLFTGFSDSFPDFSRCYAWLMLFDDGNRIDLTLEIKEEAVKNFQADTLTLLLLDKDALLPDIPLPNDTIYHIKEPTENVFSACCNEFWWCLNNVAKGIARKEFPYAMKMLYGSVLDMLDKLVEWYIGINTGFTLSTGKMGKYFKDYLSEDLYQQYLAIYSSAESAEIWQAVFVMCDLFHTFAVFVAKERGFFYKQKEEDGSLTYLRKVKDRQYQ